MCNHYRIGNGQRVLEYARSWSSPEARDETADNSPWTPAAEAWPWSNTRMPVIYQVPTGPALVYMRWGVWPPYEPTKKFVSNARDDGLTTKSLWKKSVVERRCLVAADGFYEWAGPKGAKWEVLFHLEDERPFFFAGLWSADRYGGERGFAIVTGKPNAVVAALPHDRMPVILDDAGARAWISGVPLDNGELERVCAPYPGALARKDMSKPQGRPSGKAARDTGDVQIQGELTSRQDRPQTAEDPGLTFGEIFGKGQ